jgi:alpha-tubulin suppressor-like RCC1 family protein
VTELAGVSAFGLGYAHSCARHATGTACWGAGDVGQLGEGDTVSRAAPAPVSLADVVQIDGGEQHTCARRANGEVWCWGWDRYKQVGGGGDRSEPARMALDGAARDLAVGGQHTCAVLDDGRVFCWGRNIQGQLGSWEAGSESAAPVEVEGLLAL